MTDVPTTEELDALADYQTEKLEFEEHLAPAGRHDPAYAAYAYQTREALELLKEFL